MIEDVRDEDPFRDDPPGADDHPSGADDGRTTSVRRNRGFWLVAGTMALTSIVVVVAIFANLGVKDTIAHAQHSLLSAQAAAERIRASTGSFEEADAAGLARELPELAFGDADTASRDLDEVSVFADDSTWAAAVQARPGACFFLRLSSSGSPTYGSGTVCTGHVADTSSVDTGW